MRPRGAGRAVRGSETAANFTTRRLGEQLRAAIGIAWSEGGLILSVGAGSDLSGSERPHIATLLARGGDANFFRRWDDRGFRRPALMTAPARMAGLLRVFGRLPGTGVMEGAEAGVRKASREETAGEFALAVPSGYGDLAPEF